MIIRRVEPQKLVFGECHHRFSLNSDASVLQQSKYIASHCNTLHCDKVSSLQCTICDHSFSSWKVVEALWWAPHCTQIVPLIICKPLWQLWLSSCSRFGLLVLQVTTNSCSIVMIQIVCESWIERFYMTIPWCRGCLQRGISHKHVKELTNMSSNYCESEEFYFPSNSVWCGKAFVPDQWWLNPGAIFPCDGLRVWRVECTLHRPPNFWNAFWYISPLRLS